MKPTEHSAGHFLEDSLQLHVPSYQRAYEWDDDRLVDLWRDLAHQYRARTKKAPVKDHFMGALILERLESRTGITSVSVIDGQQRLVTLLVLLAAIRDHIAYQAKTRVEPDNELSRIKLKYSKDLVPRMLLKPQDQSAIDAILAGAFLKEIDDGLFDQQLTRAYRFFRYQLWIGRDAVLQHALSFPPRPRRARSAPPRGSYEPWGRPAAARKSIELPQLHSIATDGLRFLELMLEPTDEESGVKARRLPPPIVPPHRSCMHSDQIRGGGR